MEPSACELKNQGSLIGIQLLYNFLNGDFLKFEVFVIVDFDFSTMETIVTLLNHGIWQLNYHQGKRLPNKTMKVKHVFCLPTIML